jgi:hypothetical protein
MQTAEFVELLAVPQAQAKNPLFDIIVEDKINIQNYCNALIAKILELKQSQFPAFIDYQFNLVKNPEVWICKLEKLLANNEAFFSSKTAMSRYNKLYILIEKKRTELQSSRVKEPVAKTPKSSSMPKVKTVISRFMKSKSNWKNWKMTTKKYCC